MGTQRVQMEWVLTWLVRWAFRAGTRDFYSALAAMVSPIQNILFLTLDYIFQFMCSHRPATWAGSCVGPPVSVYKQAATDMQAFQLTRDPCAQACSKQT